MSFRTILKTCVLAAAAAGLGWAGHSAAEYVPEPFHGGTVTYLIVAMAIAALLFPWIRATHLLQDSQRELERMARTDMLTGLANRWAFFAEAKAILASRTPHSFVAVLMIDLDHFKQINDTLGHAAGDEVLRRSAETILASTNGSFEGRHVVGRIGGEEFCVVAEVSRAQQAEEIAEAICRTLANRPIENRDVFIPVTASIGVAVLDEIVQLDSAISAADDAAYTAKDEGRNRWVRHGAASSQPRAAEFSETVNPSVAA